MFTLSTADFGKMFAGKLKPTTAFMTGKLKIEGNMGKAMSLEKLMGKLQKRTFTTLVQDTRHTGQAIFQGCGAGADGAELFETWSRSKNDLFNKYFLQSV